jgi:hypothetical protein
MSADVSGCLLFTAYRFAVSSCRLKKRRPAPWAPVPVLCATVSPYDVARRDTFVPVETKVFADREARRYFVLLRTFNC